MELAETIIEAFAFLIAVAAVLAVIYLIVMKYFDSKRGDLERALHQEKMKQFLPIQMQAYERLILFLERIHPERLVFRVNKPGMSARIMQAEILKLVRDEFDHNLAQQLYISNEAWVAVCSQMFLKSSLHLSSNLRTKGQQDAAIRCLLRSKGRRHD